MFAVLAFDQSPSGSLCQLTARGHRFGEAAFLGRVQTFEVEFRSHISASPDQIVLGLQLLEWALVAPLGQLAHADDECVD